MTSSSQNFRIVIQEVISISGRPGLQLAGKIESGFLHIGDRLNLVDGETVIREVTCDAIDYLDNMQDPELALVAVGVTALKAGEAKRGQALVSIENDE